MFADETEGYTLAHQDFSRKQLKRFVAHDKAARKLAAKKKRKAGNTMKVPVSTDGLVYLSASELAGASGLSEKRVKKYLKSQRVRVTSAGKKIPVIAARKGAGMWFYGEAPERNDISENMYLLQFGVKGKKMKILRVGQKRVLSDEQSFSAHVRVEENHQPLYLYINKPSG